jgi:hypothetical protein
LTVKVGPLRAIVPLRAPPVFGSTVNCTVAGPVPFVADGTWIHGTVGFALHVHAPLVFTLNDPDPPPDGTAWLLEEIDTAQPLACVTVNGCVAIVTVP